MRSVIRQRGEKVVNGWAHAQVGIVAMLVALVWNAEVNGFKFLFEHFQGGRDGNGRRQRKNLRPNVRSRIDQCRNQVLQGLLVQSFDET